MVSHGFAVLRHLRTLDCSKWVLGEGWVKGSGINADPLPL